MSELSKLRGYMTKVLERTPALSSFGMSCRSTKEKFSEYREELLTPHCLRQFKTALDWLRDQPKQEKLNRKKGSYGLKHVVERASGTYVCNGAFIAAAIHLGIRIERCEDGSPNVYLAIKFRVLDGGRVQCYKSVIIEPV